MGSSAPDQIKYREISFRGPHPDPHQAQTAALLLSDINGILNVSLSEADSETLRISYDVRAICLQLIEEVLVEVGYHLDGNLLIKMKRAIYYYTEEIERETLGCNNTNCNCARDVFIENYRRHVHGCRDHRPLHWRKYL